MGMYTAVSHIMPGHPHPCVSSSEIPMVASRSVLHPIRGDHHSAPSSLHPHAVLFAISSTIISKHSNSGLSTLRSTSLLQDSEDDVN